MRLLNNLLKLKTPRLTITLVSIAFSLVITSCKKYLEAKPDKSFVVASTVSDLQGILDNSSYMNTKSSEAGEIAADNYYLTDNAYLALSQDRMRNAYLWKPGIFIGMSPSDWVYEYNVVYNANVVLDEIEKIEKNQSNLADWNNCKGSALVYRAKAYFEIAQIWCKAFDSSTATTDLGIALRESPDFNIKSVRSTLKETYEQIISDLKEAISLLPINPPSFPYRPYKATAYGFLARTYLVMGDYNNAGKYSDSCLQLKNSLLNYNSLSTSASFPFSSMRYTNPEEIFHSTCIVTNSNLRSSSARIDSNLYKSYSLGDLRKDVFFKKNSDGTYAFKGSYDGSANNYSGLAVDEMYLIRAECNARLGNITAAMNDLNTLISKRWKTGFTIVPFAASDIPSALSLILTERRKELVFRMLRFSDIKRLNLKGANITITRVIQGQTFLLPPNDIRFALPIPDDVIQLSGMSQNPGYK